MATGDQKSCDQVVLRGSATQKVVTATAREGELPPDAQTGENCEWGPVPETRAVAQATAKTTPGSTLPKSASKALHGAPHRTIEHGVQREDVCRTLPSS